MIKRFRDLLGISRSPDDDAGARLFPLCRLRHATLHPGATLLTPGVGGGNLGVGAAEALAAVGIGGELVVGFQTSARDRLHPEGVLTRVDGVEPFPAGWDPAGLGATQRYRLTGMRRVALDLDSCTNRKVPTVLCVEGPDDDDSLAMPDEALCALLAALSQADNAWPDYWREAFATLPDAPLGQWATSLGWRIPPEERLELFDQPSRIAEVVYSTLDSLHLGATPKRRRDAVRQQTLTRRTTSLPDRTLTVTADADGWALFHPSDMRLENGSNGADPTVTHLALGNLVAVAAPARAYRLRVTTEAPSAADARRVTSSARFRLYVRHGRLFLGGAAQWNAAGLEDNLAFAQPSAWLDVPNGLYQVDVSALSADPEADDLDYVVRFTEVESFEDVAALACVPRLPRP